jgi:hypothetical protein
MRYSVESCDGESSVGGGTDSSQLDTTNTGAGFDSDLDVTVESPGGTPRVLDKVVVGAVLSSVADGEDTMVEVGSTGRSGEDTRAVHLEGSLVGFDSDGGRGNGDGSLKGGGVTLSNVIVVGGLNGSGLLIFASRLSSNVGVVCLRDGGVRFEELEGEVHRTTIASIVSCGAINELLLGEAHKFLVGSEVGTFHSTGGGESPARSAASLVLNGGDTSSGNPVDGGSVGDGILSGGGGVRRSFVSGHTLLLSLSHGGHEVVSDLVGSVGGVVLVDESVSLHEEFHAEFVFLDGSVGETVLGDVLHEGFLSGGKGVLGGDGTDLVTLEDG